MLLPIRSRTTLLSYPEVEAVREQFGHLTGSEIEIEFAERLFRVG